MNAYAAIFSESALAALLLPLAQNATFFAMKAFAQGSPVPMVVAAALGTTLGHAGNYALGLVLGWARDREHIYVNEKLYSRSRRIACVFLWPLLLLTWAGLGGLIPFVAGFFRGRAWKVLALVAVGQAGYYGYMFVR